MRSVASGFVLTQAASWLWQWMEAVGVERACFIGHSMGGAICIQLAAEHPDAVIRLVLAAPAIGLERRSVFHYTLPLLTGVRYMQPGFFPILLYDALRAGPATLLRAARDLLAHDLHTAIKEISSPSLLLWGENDTLVPAALGQQLCAEMSDAHLIILKRAGHVCMFDQATEFNKHVLTFLQNEIYSL